MRIWNERYSKVIKIELNDDKWIAYHCLLSLLSRQISEPCLGLGLASPLKTLCLKGIGLQRRQRVAKAFSVAPWRICFFPSRHRSPTAASRWRHGTTMTSGSFHWALGQISQIRFFMRLKIPTFKHIQARQHESLIPLLPPMTRTCELEHATMQTRSHGHKIQIEIFGNSNHGLSIWCSGCNVNCQQRCCNDAPSRSGDTALHCISLHHCIALKWDLALKNLEPSHIAHMDKLYKLAKMKRIEKSTCAWWQCHAQSS